MTKMEASHELVERLRQEARIHAQEARAANATIAEIYQICTGSKGEPGNWNGAEPVRQLAEQRAQLLEAFEQLLDKKDRQAALSQGSTSPYAKGAGSAIEIFAAEVRSAIANATQQRNATGGEG